MARSTRHHQSSSRRIACAVAAVAALTVSTLAVRAQGDGTLTLFLAVTDASGMPVTDLKPEDISMSESGQPGKVVTLEKFSLPIKVTVALDNGKESSRALSNFRNALNGFVDALPADVEMTLITTAPSPRTHVKPTTDKTALKKGINSFGVDNDESPRFTDSIVEYAQRIDKEFKDKKLNYSPELVLISTTAADATSYQIGDTEKAMNTLRQRGARVSLVMTTTAVQDAEANDQLKNGRQALIGGPLSQATRGKFEALRDSAKLITVLPEWGKMIAASHAKQVAQWRLVLQRPAGAPAQLNPQNLDLRVTRTGLQAAVSGDGHF